MSIISPNFHLQKNKGGIALRLHDHEDTFPGVAVLLGDHQPSSLCLVWPERSL